MVRVYFSVDCCADSVDGWDICSAGAALADSLASFRAFPFNLGPFGGELPAFTIGTETISVGILVGFQPQAFAARHSHAVKVLVSSL